MQRVSKMLSKTTLGRMLRALLKRYALTTWRHCKQGTVDEFFSAEDAGPSEAIQRKFWHKNTATAAANSTDVFLEGLPERGTGYDLSLKLRSGSSNITYLRDSPFLVALFPQSLLWEKIFHQNTKQLPVGFFTRFRPSDER